MNKAEQRRLDLLESEVRNHREIIHALLKIEHTRTDSKELPLLRPNWTVSPKPE